MKEKFMRQLHIDGSPELTETCHIVGDKTTHGYFNSTVLKEHSSVLSTWLTIYKHCMVYLHTFNTMEKSKNTQSVHSIELINDPKIANKLNVRHKINIAADNYDTANRVTTIPDISLNELYHFWKLVDPSNKNFNLLIGLLQCFFYGIRMLYRTHHNLFAVETLSDMLAHIQPVSDEPIDETNEAENTFHHITEFLKPTNPNVKQVFYNIHIWEDINNHQHIVCYKIDKTTTTNDTIDKFSKYFALLAYLINMNNSQLKQFVTKNGSKFLNLRAPFWVILVHTGILTTLMNYKKYNWLNMCTILTFFAGGSQSIFPTLLRALDYSHLSEDKFAKSNLEIDNTNNNQLGPIYPKNNKSCVMFQDNKSNKVLLSTYRLETETNTKNIRFIYENSKSFITCTDEMYKIKMVQNAIFNDPRNNIEVIINTLAYDAKTTVTDLITRMITTMDTLNILKAFLDTQLVQNITYKQIIALCADPFTTQHIRVLDLYHKNTSTLITLCENLKSHPKRKVIDNYLKNDLRRFPKLNHQIVFAKNATRNVEDVIPTMTNGKPVAKALYAYCGGKTFLVWNNDTDTDTNTDTGTYTASKIKFVNSEFQFTDSLINMLTNLTKGIFDDKVLSEIGLTCLPIISHFRHHNTHDKNTITAQTYNSITINIQHILNLIHGNRSYNLLVLNIPKFINIYHQFLQKISNIETQAKDSYVDNFKLSASDIGENNTVVEAVQKNDTIMIQKISNSTDPNVPPTYTLQPICATSTDCEYAWKGVMDMLTMIILYGSHTNNVIRFGMVHTTNNTLVPCMYYNKEYQKMLNNWLSKPSTFSTLQSLFPPTLHFDAQHAQVFTKYITDTADRDLPLLLPHCVIDQQNKASGMVCLLKSRAIYTFWQCHLGNFNYYHSPNQQYDSNVEYTITSEDTDEHTYMVHAVTENLVK